MEFGPIVSLFTSDTTFLRELLKRICTSTAEKWFSQYAPAIGVFGDSVTFAGGLLLAFDAAHREREFARIVKITSVVKEMSQIQIELGGRIIKDKDDVETVFIHRSSVKAFIGCVLLSIGFLFLLLVRISEICKSSQATF